MINVVVRGVSPHPDGKTALALMRESNSSTEQETVIKTIFGDLTENEYKALKLFSSYREGLTMPFSVVDRDIIYAAHSLHEKGILIIKPVDPMNFTEGNDQFIFKLFRWARDTVDENQLIETY